MREQPDFPVELSEFHSWMIAFEKAAYSTEEASGHHVLPFYPNYHKMREATMKWRRQTLLTLGMAGEYWRLRAQDFFRHCQCQQQSCARSLQSPALATQEGRKEGIVEEERMWRGFLVSCKIRAVDSIQMVAHMNEIVHTQLTLNWLSIIYLSHMES